MSSWRGNNKTTASQTGQSDHPWSRVTELTWGWPEGTNYHVWILETVETIFAGYSRSEEHKRLAPDVVYTSATRVGLVDDVRDTDCRTQNGGVDDSVFANVDFLTNNNNNRLFVASHSYEPGALTKT